MSDINEDVTVEDEVTDSTNGEDVVNPDTPTDGEEVIDPDEPTDEPVEELSPEEKHRITIMRHAYQKLDSLPLGFGLPAYSDDITDEMVSKYFSLDLSDALRESGISVDSLEENSYNEMMIENRVVYYALKRFRLTSATFFKFSTATDGKTVDKTNVPKMLQQILSEYDNEYKSWKSRGAGGLWNRTATINYTNV